MKYRTSPRKKLLLLNPDEILFLHALVGNTTEVEREACFSTAGYRKDARCRIANLDGVGSDLYVALSILIDQIDLQVR